MEQKTLLELEDKVLSGEVLTFEEGMFIHDYPDGMVFDLLSSASRIRKRFKGDEIRLCSIINAKSGRCPEDCAFCAQSIRNKTGVKSYPMVEEDTILDAAGDALRNGAGEFSIVTSGKGVCKGNELKTIAGAIKGINRETPLESCASLGILDESALLTLREAGLKSYHHNLETSRSFFPSICTTHDYEEDVKVVGTAKRLGLHVCCGGVFGMGESREDRIELALTLRELKVDSIPINFLNPRPGTVLSDANYLTPMECVKIISTYRFIMPLREIIICGGREVNLRELQPLIFAAGANGMMIGNYLTTQGRDIGKDIQMIKDLGLKITSHVS
ncbi:MAG: biotin synthase BioB [Thermodesulfobacteriota bacterium]